MRKKYHELSLAKKFSLTSIGFFFLTILVLTVLIQFLYEKSVLNITSESYKEKFEIVSDNSQSILENSGKIAKVILTDEAIQNWFLQDSEESADQLKYKMQVEKRLDYLDALYPDKQYSSISVFDSYGHMVNSNSIRSEASKYEQFFNIIKENYNVKWLDLYEVSLGDYEKNGIGYIRYGETGSYLIADTDGNKKIENDQDVSGNISEEEYFQWAEDNKKGGKVFRIDGKRYLVTASVIPTLDWLMIGLTPVNELTKAGKAMTQIIYVVGIIAALISTFFSLRVSHSVTKPLIYLTDTMKKFGKGDLSVRVPVLYEDEIGILSEEFNKMSEQIRQLVDQVYREQRAKRKSELAALQAQINPHFLYNTLNSVSSLIKMNCPDEAFIMIQAIGTFYRTSLSDGKTLIPLEQEITNIENYIKIQKVRYGNKIEYEIDIENEILQEWIVKLTLQPLIENSIYHGIKEMRGKGIIRIKGWKEKNKVFIQVSDNGLGIPEEKLEELFSKDYREKGSAFGLFNIQQRLQIYFGKEYGLTVESKLSQGTKATVCIPVDFKREEDRKCGYSL